MLDILKNLTNDTYSFQDKNPHFKALCSKDFKKEHFFTLIFNVSLHQRDILRKLLRSSTFISLHFRSLSHKIQWKILGQFIVLLKTKLTLLFIQSPPLFIPLDLKVGLTTAALGVCCKSLERSLTTISHWSSCLYHDKGMQTPSLLLEATAPQRNPSTSQTSTTTFLK